MGIMGNHGERLGTDGTFPLELALARMSVKPIKSVMVLEE